MDHSMTGHFPDATVTVLPVREKVKSRPVETHLHGPVMLWLNFSLATAVGVCGEAEEKVTAVKKTQQLFDATPTRTVWTFLRTASHSGFVFGLEDLAEAHWKLTKWFFCMVVVFVGLVVNSLFGVRWPPRQCRIPPEAVCFVFGGGKKLYNYTT
ncbi:hypothetical protein ABG768_013723 [Culter alburnus]|uniref:Uncharacterized protein n=1 Tax=Culter alburnus TaxID=194366 RepID=A0AAW2B4K0_CULAL